MTEQTPNEPQAETVSEGGAVAVREPRKLAALEAQGGGVLPIMPRNIEEAQRYANGLIAGGLVPDSFKDNGQPNPAKVLMGVLKAMEIGVPPQTGLAGLYVIGNRLAVFGDLAAALVQRGGLVKDQQVREIGPAFDPALPLGEWPEDYGYTVSYWRVGQEQPYIGTFTVRDAKRANLWMNSRKQPWLQYPRRMLFNRARALAIRDGFADALHGLAIAEEAQDHAPPVEERGPSKRLAALTDETPETEGGDVAAN